MRMTILTIVAAVALSATVAAAVIHSAGPSTAELDAEIASTKTEIAAADAQAALYSGGLILVQTELRAAILKNTLAMLEQKRASFLRGIRLNYQEPTPRISNPTDDATALSELEKARGDAKAAQREAAMYSGGLIQTMALVREATAKTTEAAIEQRIAFMKLGIPLPSLSGTSPPVPASPGKTTSDKNAL
jgi:ABC-type iron transport system FetAB ATPase subunit